MRIEANPMKAGIKENGMESAPPYAFAQAHDPSELKAEAGVLPLR